MSILEKALTALFFDAKPLANNTSHSKNSQLSQLEVTYGENDLEDAIEDVFRKELKDATYKQGKKDKELIKWQEKRIKEFSQLSIDGGEQINNTGVAYIKQRN